MSKLLLKGRKGLPEGTIKIWKGKRYKKTAGKWSPIGKGRRKAGIEEESGLNNVGNRYADFSNERQALAVSNDRKALRERLQRCYVVLKNEWKKQFGKAVFDFKNKRLVSEDGRFALQWQLRNDPNSPESYENQQTSQGDVFVMGMNSKERERQDTLYQEKGKDKANEGKNWESVYTSPTTWIKGRGEGDDYEVAITHRAGPKPSDKVETLRLFVKQREDGKYAVFVEDKIWEKKKKGIGMKNLSERTEEYFEDREDRRFDTPEKASAFLKNYIKRNYNQSDV